MSEEVKIAPGDTLVVRLPATQPNRSITSSVRVLDRQAKDDNNFVGQIIDLVMFSSRDNKFAPGAIVEIPKKDVINAWRAEVRGQRACLMVEVSNGLVVGLHRVDGKTDPISVLVADRDTGCETVFCVDARTATAIATSEQEEPELPFSE